MSSQPASSPKSTGGAPPRSQTTSAPGPAVRGDAAVDAAVVHLREAAAVKVNAFPNHPGRPSGMSNFQTHLHVEVWVRNDTFAKTVWSDVHVVSADGEILRRASFPLDYERPAGDGGDVFVLDEDVFQGSVATPGAVMLKPDVRHIDFRLYAEMNGRTATDDVAHRCELAPDYASS